MLAFHLPVPGLSQSEIKYVNIGLLLPDNSHSDIIEAAELAIEEANRAGGYLKQEFRVLSRTTEGFWGAGSKESVSMVYEDNVRAIVGHLDGRNGHLAEQVATKSHLSYIETFATESTLSQAFVPWFMRVVPNDNQQAFAIIKQIQKEGSGKICILSKEDYDTRYAVKSLTKTVARESGKTAVVINVEKADTDQETLVEEILLNEPGHLIIPFEDASLNRIIEKLREKMPELKVYGTLNFCMGVEKRNEDWKLYEDLYIIKPLTRWREGRTLPDSPSAYVYDAVRLVIRAVHQVGTDREAITDYISKSTYPEGVTGSISFDELGNREDAARLFHVKNGMAHELKLP